MCCWGLAIDDQLTPIILVRYAKVFFAKVGGSVSLILIKCARWIVGKEGLYKALPSEPNRCEYGHASKIHALVGAWYKEYTWTLRGISTAERSTSVENNVLPFPCLLLYRRMRCEWSTLAFEVLVHSCRLACLSVVCTCN